MTEKLDLRVVIKSCAATPMSRCSAACSTRRAHAGLSDPAVVTVFSVLDETDPPAIVMEFW